MGGIAVRMQCCQQQQRQRQQQHQPLRLALQGRPRSLVRHALAAALGTEAEG